MMLKRGVFCGAVFSTLMLVNVSSAFAGFEWKTPAAEAVPAAPSLSAPSTEDIMWDKGSMPAQKVTGIEAMPLSSGTVSKKGAQMAAPVAVSPDVISGFGKDLPLSVALQQVVPPQYKVNLAKGVDGGAIVSWQGDKPWKLVLADMLQERGLVYSVQGNSLEVRPLQTANNSPANKMEMIPEDMVASLKQETLSAPAPVTIHREKPAPESAPVADEMPPITGEVEVAAPLVPTPAAPVAVTPAPAPTLVADTPPSVIEPQWHASKGQTLRNILQNWSKTAHVELYWATDYDYKLNTTVAYGGNFNEAVKKLFDQFAMAKPQPYGRLHRQAQNGEILVVNTYDTSN